MVHIDLVRFPGYIQLNSGDGAGINIFTKQVIFSIYSAGMPKCPIYI